MSLVVTRGMPAAVPSLSADEWISQSRRSLSLITSNKRFVPHRPSAKQAAFLTLQDIEAMYGGAAGGGKSDALLMAALQYVHVPRYTALLLRLSFKDLSLPDALMDRAQQWLGGTDAVWRSQEKTWTFPSGARIVFGYMASDNDVYQYQSAAFQFIGFDELTQFSEFRYRYMFSRLRRPNVPCVNCGEPVDLRNGSWEHANETDACHAPAPDPQTLKEYKAGPDGLRVLDVPLRIRSATNPGGFGHAWVKQRFIDEGLKEGRWFVPASLYENPYIDKRQYEQSLSHLDPVTRRRLLSGDWTAREAGNYFDRMWLSGKYLKMAQLPRGIRWIRMWDLAATEPHRTNKDPDWTVGLLMGELDGRFYIRDVRRRRIGPAEAIKWMRATAEEDGVSVEIWVEQEGGSSGKFAMATIRQALTGFELHPYNPSGSKTTRFGPFSSAAEAGNVYLVRTDRWPVTDYLDELEGFDQAEHDDQVDATSGAHLVLSFTDPHTGKYQPLKR